MKTIFKIVVKVFSSIIHLLRVCLCKVRLFFCNYKHIFIRFVWSLASILYLSFPFLYRIVPFNLAQYIWYSSLIVLVVLFIISLKKSNRKSRVERWYNCPEFKTPFTISLFLFFALVFVHNYYLAFSFKPELWVFSPLFIFGVCLILYIVIQNKIDHFYSSEELYALIKKAVYNSFSFLFCLIAYLSNSYGLSRYVFIFGTIFTILIIWDSISNFLDEIESNSLFVRVAYKYYLLGEFVIGLTSVIYLIQLIPDSYSSLQTIITIIVSSVIGGSLTLVGVAWTIKRQDKLRSEEEKKKYSPLIFIEGYLNNVESISSNYPPIILKNFCLNSSFGQSIDKESNGQKNQCIFYDILVCNAEYSYCSLVGIIINNNCFLSDYAHVLEKNKEYKVSIMDHFDIHNQVDSVALLLKDTLGNYYRLNLVVEIEEKDALVAIKVIGSQEQFAQEILPPSAKLK